MNIMDLVKAIAPDCEVDVVGIRPGEKLHEVMVPEDDARLTLEFDRYFVIQPAFHWWSEAEFQQIGGGGRKVPDGFRYSSDTNDRWLGVDELRRMIQA
jgi:UDP-N-acetylglucosamine 4,6-dehydratase